MDILSTKTVNRRILHCKIRTKQKLLSCRRRLKILKQ